MTNRYAKVGRYAEGMTSERNSARTVGENHVEFITREQCPLCEEGEKVLRAAAKRWGLTIRLLDIDEDADLLEEFSERVPVIRTAAGRVIDEGRISILRVNAGLIRLRTTLSG